MRFSQVSCACTNMSTHEHPFQPRAAQWLWHKVHKGEAMRREWRQKPVHERLEGWLLIFKLLPTCSFKAYFDICISFRSICTTTCLEQTMLSHIHLKECAALFKKKKTIIVHHWHCDNVILWISSGVQHMNPIMGGQLNKLLFIYSNLRTKKHRSSLQGWNFT